MKQKKTKKVLKSSLKFFLLSILAFKNLDASGVKSIEKISKKNSQNIEKNAQIDIDDEKKIDLMYKKEENSLDENFLKYVKITGRFHFFNSYTNEDYRKNKDLETLMQGDGRVNFFYEKKFEDGNVVYSSFEIKKKYDNATKLKSLIGIKSEKYGDLKIASFNPIFDEFETPYSVNVSSSGAWLRNINSSFDYPESVTSPIVNDIDSVIGFYTDHDLTSVMYKTSSFKGFGAAISYTNDTRFRKNVQKNFPYKNVLSVSGNYKKNLSDDLKLSLSAMTEMGSSYQRDLIQNGVAVNEPTLDDLRSFLFSGLVEYKKLQFVAMYANFFKTNRFAKIPVLETNEVPAQAPRIFIEPQSTYYVSAAASYKFTDKLKGSITQFYSENGQDYAAIAPANPSTGGASGQVKFYSTSLAASYQVYKNSLAPYIEITKFTVKDNSAILESQKKKDNNGYVIVIGAKASF